MAGMFVCLLAAPLGAPHAMAAAGGGETSGSAIIPVQSASSQTTTPDACAGRLNACATEMLTILNADRSLHGLAPLTLVPQQSKGAASCVGSYGHSLAMARSAAIWHINPRYPRASFPRSICVPYTHAGENVGESASGNVHNDLEWLDAMMMAEPHSHAACASTVNHACNILNPAFHRVGIGVYYVDGATWLTEDFTN
jgi:uncharacterized protein YkwD